MNVLIVGLGGVTQSFRHWPERVLALALARRGHAVWAIGTHDPSRPALAARREVVEGVQVVRVRSGYWPNRELARALSAGPRPDIIHLMHPRNVLAAQTTAWARRRGIPTVYTWLGPFHDHYLAPNRERPFDAQPTYERLIFSRWKLLRRLPIERRPRDLLRNYRLHWPLRAAAALAPCSEFEATIMRRLGMTQPQRVIPLWIDAPAIRETPLRPPRLDLPRPWLLFVGQLTPRKGYDLAVRALPEIIAAHPNASLLIVSGINQAQREQLVELARSAGVERHVHVLGSYLPDDELVNLYRASDALLFPTRYEGFGLPLLEAMAADCPLVTTDIPVVREIVRDGENGLLAAPDDPSALARAALRLLGDGGLRERLIAGGRVTLRERYAEEALVGQIEALYRDVLEHHAP
ncbi:MAG: glycosyltransferase family 4 protein [Kouleothrix sp.]|nr:glycosyltransferase family 4 protein [Kouleothrix sp.]